MCNFYIFQKWAVILLKQFVTRVWIPSKIWKKQILFKEFYFFKSAAFAQKLFPFKTSSSFVSNVNMKLSYIKTDRGDRHNDNNLNIWRHTFIQTSSSSLTFPMLCCVHIFNILCLTHSMYYYYFIFLYIHVHVWQHKLIH